MNLRETMAVKSSEPFVVMAKPVGPRCNLQCGYCYYLNTEQACESPHPFRMADVLLETYIRQYIEASPGPVVQFTWHGGEPTLAGLDFYRLAVELQKRFLPDGWTCWNNLQTNGVLLDDDWCAFLAEQKFDVGLSVDGTQRLHDGYRKDLGGHGTYGLAVAAVRRLQSHGVQPDLLCTVTSEIAKEPVEVYRALSALGTGWIQFIPILNRAADGQLAPESVTGEAYGTFLCAVFNEWVCNDIGRLDVQQFAEAQLVFTGGVSTLCWMASTCGRVLVVEQDGSVYACDHFVNPEHRIGSIVASHLGALVDAPEQRRFGEAKRSRLPQQCLGCQWLALCNGGCPKDRFALAENGEPGLNVLCDGLRRFFDHAGEPLRLIAQLRQRGYTPDAIRFQVLAESQARWKGVGRNDACPCGSGLKAKNCCWPMRLV